MVGASLVVQSVIISLSALAVRAYIPAQPANESSAFVDIHDDSQLYLTWNPNGISGTSISYQQHGRESLGISKGALIRVKEEDMLNNSDTTTTPWIAFINCDSNATDIDMDTDIFTKVSEKGAKAALLYSNTSDSCSVNSEYLTGEFDQLFDIFTTKTAASAKAILSQYQHVNLTFSTYDSGLLNASYEDVKRALPRDASNHSPYMVAILRGANATLEDPSNSDPVPTRGPSSNSNSSQSLAMIILYVIVGVVSALFVIVILSGAIRAFRHPERYGPRLYHPGMDGEEGVPQTRAAGLTRAILDTFPVVKFGRHNDTPLVPRSQQRELKVWDAEAANASNASSVFLRAPQGRRNAPSDESHPTPTLTRSSTELEKKRSSQPSPTNDNVTNNPGAEVAGNTTPSDIDPAAIGTETCPICIVDFEEGDDLRVLPCEGKHRFHKDCVDPWLLELSSSCPICREDFQALENMAVAAGTEEQQAAEAEDRFSPQEEHQDPPTAATSRFSRYMHFAQRRRRSQRDSNTSSARNATPTHPPAPFTDY